MRGLPIIGPEWRTAPPFLQRSPERKCGSPNDKGVTSDALLSRLLCAWIFLQCFEYRYLPWLDFQLGISLSPDRLLFGAILFVYLTRSTAAKNHFEGVRGGTAAIRLEQFMFVFGLVGIASWAYVGADAGNARFRFLTTLFYFPFWPACAYFIARRLKYSTAMLLGILRLLAVLCVYLSFTAVCEHFLPSLVFPNYIMDPSVGIHFGRSRGPFLSSPGLGGNILVTFVGFSSLLSDWIGLKRVVGLVVTLFSVLGLYFTDTRANWLGCAAVMIIMIVLRTPMRKNAVLLAGLLFVGFFSGVGSKFSFSEKTLFSRRQETVDYRYANYQTTFNMFKDHPVFGIGYGQFLKEWDKYFPKDADVTGLTDGNHSTLLGALAELGIVGFASYVAALGCGVYLCIRAYPRLRDPFERKFAVVGLGAIGSFFILGLTNDLRWDQMYNVIVFWLVGIVSSIDVNSIALRKDIRGTSSIAPNLPNTSALVARRFGLKNASPFEPHTIHKTR